jgi:hypothetical protein
MSSAVGKLLIFLPLAVFVLGFGWSTLDLAAAEPYQRIVVG